MFWLDWCETDNACLVLFFIFRRPIVTDMAKEACAAIEKAANIKPSDPEIALDLTKALFNAGRKNEAISRGLKTIAQLPPGYDTFRSGLAHMCVGLMLLAEKQPDEGLGMLEAAKKLHPAGYPQMDIDSLIALAKSEIAKSPASRQTISLALPL